MIRGCGKGRAEKGHSPVEDEWMRTCVVGNSPPLIPKHTSCDPQYHSVGNFARLACEFSGRNSLLWSVQFGADLLPERVPRNAQVLQSYIRLPAYIAYPVHRIVCTYKLKAREQFVHFGLDCHIERQLFRSQSDCPLRVSRRPMGVKWQ